MYFWLYDLIVHGEASKNDLELKGDTIYKKKKTYLAFMNTFLSNKNSESVSRLIT